ncbi:uncharacterized transmembrane protein DDB_G0289901-like [Phalaenopsis equestris]|uniref:uncharacterized transmembrane protein DDB_G0289901-like n=1 Tax=Phalaenopsis equestris TaxID=78828 RepID=UPI0009E3B2B6|nr:uncharacterized transmembrane protein DDB_G0289901-like [Phalaenopsis equestris]XP_020593524.1 uncharacterized transmembrane protein DDB_G0289901-like [Phalaenopsis equestris]XP_020593525.1 uncharacterized transmembrane protein DDB_G0289901-like [Phalaenopsis equestris]XP_020593526.1 uncharacterized transmembrane protein DDB_G0289901-like [Phalaenopsis equestris]
MMEKGSSSKSACWCGPGDGNIKRESGGWSRWPASTSKTTTRQSNQSEGRTALDDESTMACKRGWNKGRDGREKWEIGGNGFDHNGCDGRRRSLSNNHSVDKGCMSKSASWDRGKHENVKRENDGWHRWPGAMSKATKHYAGHQNRKDCWNESETWTTSENISTVACKRGWNESGNGKQKRENGGDAFYDDNSDGWRQSGANIHVVEKGRLSKSASWDLAQDENANGENDGWPGWPGVMSKTIQQCGWITEDGCTMAGARGWNVSGDEKGRRETADGGDTFDHDGRDGSRPCSSNIHTVDKRSLSKSSWDLATNKIKNDEFPRWPGALSKTTGQIPSHQNQKLGWQSQGWTQADHGDSQKESGERNSAFVQTDDSWMQRGSSMSTKCDWNASKSWNALNGDNLDREQRKWDPGLDRSGGDPCKQIRPAEPPKANRRKFGSGAFAQGEDSIRMKSKWSDGSGFSDPNGSKQHRLRWAASMMPATGEQCPSNQNGPGWKQSWGGIASEDGISLKQNNGRNTDLDRSDDSWMKHRPMMLPKCDWKKFSGWNKPGGNDFDADHRSWGPDLDQAARDPWEQQLRPTEVPKFDYSIREKNKLSGAPDFDDADALNQNMHTFLPSIGGKRPLRNKNPSLPSL